MFTCVICRFETEADDAIAPTSSGRCLCLRCFHRETQTSLPMTKALRRDVLAVLDELSVA